MSDLLVNIVIWGAVLLLLAAVTLSYVDLFRRKDMPTGRKVIWAVAIWLFALLPVIIYLAINWQGVSTRWAEMRQGSRLAEPKQAKKAATGETILKLKGVSKRFGAVQALEWANFSVRTGEVMALVGDNGAGKSTLIKCIAGIHPADEGEIWFEGKRVSITSPKDSAALGIEVVYQDLALADNLDIVQNMFLGREAGHTWAMDETTMEKRSTDVLAQLSVTTIRSVRQTVAGLSGGQRQSVAVAKAVMWNSKVVILDEPTAALGVAQTAQVLALITRLKEEGLAVVVISHNLHDVFEVADRITVLRLGQDVAEFDRKKTDQNEVIKAITAGELSSAPGLRKEAVA